VQFGHIDNVSLRGIQQKEIANFGPFGQIIIDNHLAMTYLTVVSHILQFYINIVF
jgi:hypothetical protein